MALVLVLWLGATADGAREVAQPLILLLEESYGIIAAEVLEASPIKVDGQHRYPYRYRVTFLAHRIVAQPAQGNAFPLEAKETLVVEVTVGYACMIEDWRAQGAKGGGAKASRKGGPLASGKRYYLTIKYDAAKMAYTHAFGASILVPVEQFDPQREADIRATRSVAALPLVARIARAQELLLARDATPFVRLQALALTRSCLQQHGKASEAQRRAIAACYWTLWKGDTSHLDLLFLSTLDFTMRVTLHGAFAQSQERGDTWLARLCAPLEGKTPAEQQTECSQRSNQIPHHILDTGKAHPDHVGARLMKEMNDEAWPADLHVVLVRCLLMLYRNVEAPPEAWEPFLQGYLPGLAERADGWALRLLAANLKWAAREPERQARRAFRPGPEVVRALHRARDRMHKAAADDPARGSDVRSALNALNELLKSLQ